MSSRTLRGVVEEFALIVQINTNRIYENIEQSSKQFKFTLASRYFPPTMSLGYDIFTTCILFSCRLLVNLWPNLLFEKHRVHIFSSLHPNKKFKPQVLTQSPFTIYAFPPILLKLHSYRFVWRTLNRLSILTGHSSHTHIRRNWKVHPLIYIDTILDIHIA